MFNKDKKIDAVASSVMQVIEKVTTDTTKGREPGSINSYTPSKVTLKGDVEKKPDDKEPKDTAARKSIEAKSVKSEETVQEVSPPGWSGTVKAMKKHKNISNPFALAWSMKNKGAKSHIKAEEYVDESVLGALKSGAKKVLAKVGGGSDEDQLKRLRDNMYGKVKNPQNPTVKEDAEQVEEDAQLDKLKAAHAEHHAAFMKAKYQDKDEAAAAQHDAKLNQTKKDIAAHTAKMSANKPVDAIAKDYADQEKKRGVGHVRDHVETEGQVVEGWDDMLKSVADAKKPQPNGGSGIKKGKSYGNQKPEKEEDKETKKESFGVMSLSQWQSSKIEEKKSDEPFDPPYKKKEENVTDKSGAKHTPMSRAKNLARAAMDKIKKDHKLG